MRRLLSAATLAFVIFDAPDVAGVDFNPQYEQVLFPVNFLGAIARPNGASWSVSNFFRNEHSSAVEVIWGGSPVCPVGNCDRVTPPGGESQLYADRIWPAGLFHVPDVSNIAGRIRFSSRLINSVDATATLELPVVRERDFRREAFSLIRIPVDPSSKIDVRVYDPRSVGVTYVRVSVFDEATGATLAEFPVELFGHADRLSEVARAFPEYPALVYVGDLATRFPAVRTARSLRITFTPLTEGMDFWAMASVTDNVTNRISLFTPQ